MPARYTKLGDAVYNQASQEVGGATFYNGTGNGSDVFLYKNLFQSAERLYLGMGHEYLHAAFNSMGYSSSKFDSNHEASIAQWEYYQAEKLKIAIPDFVQSGWNNNYKNLLPINSLIGDGAGFKIFPLINKVAR